MSLSPFFLFLALLHLHAADKKDAGPHVSFLSFNPSLLVISPFCCLWAPTSTLLPTIYCESEGHQFAKMGIIQDAAGHPLAQLYFQQGIGAQIVIGVAGFVALSVLINVVQQFLFRNPSDPPLVFHWFPFIGSTVIYGMDPPKFFRDNRAKVGKSIPNIAVLYLRRRLIFNQ